jgi:hypothetical protein
MGSSTALHLIRSGYTPSNITVLDVYPIPSAQSAGYDLNKIMSIRLRNAPDLQLSLEALDMWKNDPLFKPFFHHVGMVGFVSLLIYFFSFHISGGSASYGSEFILIMGLDRHILLTRRDRKPEAKTPRAHRRGCRARKDEFPIRFRRRASQKITPFHPRTGQGMSSKTPRPPRRDESLSTGARAGKACSAATEAGLRLPRRSMPSGCF